SSRGRFGSVDPAVLYHNVNDRVLSGTRGARAVALELTGAVGAARRGWSLVTRRRPAVSRPEHWGGAGAGLRPAAAARAAQGAAPQRWHRRDAPPLPSR